MYQKLTSTLSLPGRERARKKKAHPKGRPAGPGFKKMTGSPTLQKSPQPSHDSNIRPEALKLLEGNIDKILNVSA